MLRVPFQAPFLVILLATAAFAGCLGTQDDLDVAVDEVAAPVPDYAAINETLLTEPVYGILDALDQRIQATTDGISLFAEVYLPDAEGDGPWPTIMHSTSYKHLDKGLSTALMAAATAQGGTVITGNSLVDFYVPRGYAVVLADVRGFGDSDGCVEVWGKNEQQDQADLVEWIAAQEWSDGKVGMIGASYPGTTPIEAAVMNPPHLTTIVAAAGLTDPYYDWHYGGVPTGESTLVGSPAAYQAIGAAPPIEPVPNPQSWMMAAANAGCGTQQLVLDAYQMDSVYTEFYEERNLASRAKQINASVLYTQGFLDGNVKPSQLLNFFNEIEAPKKGFFGQWGHQFPQRDDYRAYEHAWFDHWLMGIDNGVMDGPTAEVLTNADTWRGDDVFPNPTHETTNLYLDASDMSLAFDAPTEDATATWTQDRRPGPLMSLGPAQLGRPEAENEEIRFTSAALDEDLYLSGVVWFHFNATMDDENAYIMAELTELEDNGDGNRTRVAFGGLAAALRDGVKEYKPVPVGEEINYMLRFQPREYLVDNGSQLQLRIYTVHVDSSTTDEAIGPVTVEFLTGPSKKTFVGMPLIDGRPDIEYPWVDEDEEEA